MEKYRIDFASNNGTDYRVSIFDPNYSGQPIALEGGSVPFQKDGDADENFFMPIRTSTAKLSVIIGENDELMNELFPTNNTQRSVMLIRLPGGEVEWQGFLSCEAYTQEYVDRVRELVIPCNSVLAAMAFKNIADDVITGTMQIKDVINSLFEMALGDSGLNWLFCVPERDYAIYDKHVRTGLFYELKENQNEYEKIYSLVGNSCKEVLEKIATFMGWCVSEEGTIIYINRRGDNSPMLKCQEVGSSTTQPAIVSNKDINDFEWMGEEHQISIDAGARSVEVVANVGEFQMDNMELPKCPPINLYMGGMKMVDAGSSGFSYERLYGNHHMSLTNTIVRKQLSFAVENKSIRSVVSIIDEEGVFNESVLSLGSYVSSDTYIRKVGSFLAKMKMYNGMQEPLSTMYGLYVSGLPSLYHNGTPNETNHVYSQKSIRRYHFHNGYLKVDLSAMQITGTGGVANPIVSPFGARTLNFIPAATDDYCRIYASIRIGDKYYDGLERTWVDEFASFYMSFDHEGKPNNQKKYITDNNDCFYLPINLPSEEVLEGDVEIRLYPFFYGHGYTVQGFEVRLVDALIAKLNISFESFVGYNDSSENRYFRIIDDDFAKEESISTELATDLNNHPSDHILLNDDEDKTVMTSLDYTDGTRRPEVDLLNRMESHYNEVKRKLTLQVEHPTEPLPLLRVTDGGKTYIPVAESRDYAADSSEITLLEV